MKKFLVRLLKRIRSAEKENAFLQLRSIIQTDTETYCEFNEILRLDGKLIKFNINDIAKNKNIQQSIPPDALFIIGMIHGKHQNIINEFRVKKFDFSNNSVHLENATEKVAISVDRLLQDSDLIQQINQMDLIKILMPFIYKKGYDAHNTIHKEAQKCLDELQDLHESKKIINLF